MKLRFLFLSVVLTKVKKMKKLLVCTLVLVLMGALAAACSQASVPATITAPVQAPSPTPRANPDQKWNSLLAEARKEGTVNVYATSWGADLRSSLSQSFKEKYGINLEFTPFSRGADMLAKVQAEKRAGLNLADIFGAGGATLVGTMKPEGVLQPLDPYFVLPEIVDTRAWRGGTIPFLDNSHLAMGLVCGLQRYISFNTDTVKEGEITTYRDVLKPQYKGKITLNDPTVTGAGNALVTHLAHDLWNADDSIEFLRQVMKQEAVITRDNRQHTEWVARGKYAIGLGANAENTMQFLNMGAPISLAITREGVATAPGAGAVGLPTAFQHPNAAVVFLNWLLTKDGQTLFVRGFAAPSYRLDVPTEGIPRIYVPQPEEKLYPYTEDLILTYPKMIEAAKSVLEEPAK